MRFLDRAFVPFRAALFVPLMLLSVGWQARAVQWTLSQAGPPVWTYTLTFAPEDNYSITQTNTTITMTGLSGVTAAGAPTSTDFPNAVADHLAWTPQVLNNGTTVVWTSSTGTGNYGTTQHVFGFTITAAAAFNGTVSYATNGMSLDVEGGSSLDISGTIAGPAATGTGTTASAPALSPIALALTALGLAAAGGYQMRSRILEQLRNRG